MYVWSDGGEDGASVGERGRGKEEGGERRGQGKGGGRRGERKGGGRCKKRKEGEKREEAGEEIRREIRWNQFTGQSAASDCLLPDGSHSHSCVCMFSQASVGWSGGL